MGSRSAQFLKELQAATAHIPLTPNPAVLPCSGPKLYVGIYFDGTDNERVFLADQGHGRSLMTTPELMARNRAS
jgi:hypothetical protein